MKNNQDTIIKQNFLRVLKERRSIRTYNTSVKIPREEMEEMLALAGLAPSSSNLQPWRFVVIESPEAKEKLVSLASGNEKQVRTSSAVVAVFSDLKGSSYTEEIYSQSVKLGIMPQNVKERQVERISSTYKTLPFELKKEVAVLDSGLVSMQFMLVAKAFGYDTNPIGGYDRVNIAEVLGLEKDRYIPIILISVGKAAEEGYKSYRLPVETVAEWQ